MVAAVPIEIVANLPLPVEIGLLVAGPLLILIGAMLPPSRAQAFLIAALVIMALGTACLFVPPPAGGVAKVHGAEVLLEARTFFVGLLSLYLGVLFMPRFLHRSRNRLFSTVLPLCFLVLYSAGAVFLIQSSTQDRPASHDQNLSPTASPDPSASGRTAE